MKYTVLIVMLTFAMATVNLQAMTNLQNQTIYAGEETMVPPVDIPAPPK